MVETNAMMGMGEVGGGECNDHQGHNEGGAGSYHTGPLCVGTHHGTLQAGPAHPHVERDDSFLSLPPGDAAASFHETDANEGRETGEIINEEFKLLQVDGNTDADSEDSEGLILCKQILDRLLRNQYDQFEILSLGNKFQLNLLCSLIFTVMH